MTLKEGQLIQPIWTSFFIIVIILANNCTYNMSSLSDQIQLADLSEPSEQPSPEYEYEYEYSSSEYGSDDEDDDQSIDLRNAQLQWEQSVEQIRTLVGLVILPLLGKVLGRRFAGFGKC